MVWNYKRKKQEQYSKEDMKVAVEMVNFGRTLNEVSELFHIPSSTLHDHVKGNHPKNTGRQTVLVKEEEEMILLKNSKVGLAQSSFAGQRSQV